MKNYFLLLTVIFSLCFLSCSDDEHPQLDIVEGVDPVQSSAFQDNLVSAIRNADSDEERTEIMRRNSTRLTGMLTYFLKNQGYSCDIDSISYHYGSGKALSVESSNGTSHDGIFKSQPYAIVNGECFKDGLFVFIKCFNGTFSLKNDNYRSLGRASMIFVIEKGKGINHYTNYQTSIWLADHFDLNIYKGKGWSNRITSQEAYDLEPHIDSIRVKVKVNPGDQFDLRRMTYTPVK